jgi:hypothetical protein
MKVQNRRSLSVEVLEQREVPATVRFDGINLFVYAPHLVAGASTISVTQEAGSVFKVLDDNQNNGSYYVTGNITIIGNNGKDTISVNVSPAAGGGGLAGNLSISTNGSGTASVTVDGTAASGQLAGFTSIALGNGSSTVNLGTTNGLNDTGMVSVRAGGLAANTLNIGNGANASAFDGNITVNNFGTVNLGDGLADQFRGNVSVTDADSPQATNVTLATNAVEAGNLTVIGGTGTDSVTINGNVNGNLQTTLLSASSNNLTLAAGGNPITIGGNLYYTASNGNSVFTPNGDGGAAAGDATVQGSTWLQWGNGSNSMGLSTGFLVNGSFYVVDGNGGFDAGTSNTPGLFTANTFQGTVIGNMSLNLGNGPNTLVFDGTDGAVVGGILSLNGGNGGNTVAITNAPAAPSLIQINLNLGNSEANVFWLGEASGTVPPAPTSVTGFVNFGPPSTASTVAPTTPFNPGDNYFAPNGYVWQNIITLINIPS